MRTIYALLIVTSLTAGCGQSEPSFTSEAARREHEKLQARLQQKDSSRFETRTAGVSGAGNVSSAAALELLLDDYEAQLNECEAELRADPQSFPADADETKSLLREGRLLIRRIRAVLSRNPDQESIDIATADLLVHMQQFEDLFGEGE